MNAKVDFDIVIIGGGMVGLACAESLASRLPERRIALFETNPPGPDENLGELDLRVSALAPSSQSILDSLGVWSALPADKVCAYDCMQVWQASGQPQGSRSIRFSAAEMGEALLGHIVENRAVRRALWDAISQSGKVRLVTEQEFKNIEFGSGFCNLECESGERFTASLIIAADGARSRVRERVAADYREHSYNQSGVVAHISSAEPHQHTAWQRFLPTGPVALLPVADGRSSLVWSCPEEQAQELIGMPEADFNKELNLALDGALGQLECTSQRVRFPLGMGYARHYTGHRFALIGDAAHKVHPLAGQGANLGLLDAATLAETLTGFLQHPLADAGDARALRAYERSRKGDNLLTMGMMDLLNRLFLSPFAGLAGTGMEWCDRSALLKSRFAAYATGRGRELPAAAQPAQH